MEMQTELLENLETFPSPGKHCDCFDKQTKITVIYCYNPPKYKFETLFFG